MLDILIDTDGDILINATGLVFGDGDAQALERLLKLNTGELKATPLVGTNLIRLANKRGSVQEVKQDIKVQLINDGWINETITITGQNLSVDATRQ